MRVAGQFTVESLSPHRMLAVDENDELIDPLDKAVQDEGKDFAAIILEELKISGVQQAHKEDKILFSTLKPWQGSYICAKGAYREGGRSIIGQQFSSARNSAAYNGKGNLFVINQRGAL
ncbi:hypothetical protein AGMMS49974_10920 [Deltaproteobacteria bacterium]|nr:hypothetical protein AGMMS49974_10920 [Deltaproteobacteria bacterium]